MPALWLRYRHRRLAGYSRASPVLNILFLLLPCCISSLYAIRSQSVTIVYFIKGLIGNKANEVKPPLQAMGL